VTLAFLSRFEYGLEFHAGSARTLSTAIASPLTPSMITRPFLSTERTLLTCSLSIVCQGTSRMVQYLFRVRYYAVMTDGKKKIASAQGSAVDQMDVRLSLIERC
jgi:hypothetical protein